MIVFEDVRKSYRTKAGRKVILNNLSAILDMDVNLGILGLNGAGKSTFVRLVSGIELPDSGRIRRRARVSFPLGFSGCFHAALSGRENASIIARVYGVDPNPLIRYVRDFAELGPYFEMPIRTYSSGMRARLGFAVSIAIDFDIFLIDEATSVGDARFAARCEAALLDRRQNKRILMVSHSKSTLKSFCQAGAILHGGEITFHSKIDVAFDRYDEIIRTYTAAA